MKKIKVIYNKQGKITSCDENSMYFEQENNSLEIIADIETEYSVRAYMKASNNNSGVTDKIEKTEHGYSVVIKEEYMSKGTLYVGFETFNDNGYTERYEPLRIYIDGFVNLGTGKDGNVYIVTISINDVKTLGPDEPAYVENIGTAKDLRLNIGIPQGVQGEPGYTPQKGVDYFTPEEVKAILPKSNKEQKGVYIDNSGEYDIVAASMEDINEGTNWHRPVTPAVMLYAVGTLLKKMLADTTIFTPEDRAMAMQAIGAESSANKVDDYMEFYVDDDVPSRTKYPTMYAVYCYMNTFVRNHTESMALKVIELEDRIETLEKAIDG